VFVDLGGSWATNLRPAGSFLEYMLIAFLLLTKVCYWARSWPREILSGGRSGVRLYFICRSLLCLHLRFHMVFVHPSIF